MSITQYIGKTISPFLATILLCSAMPIKAQICCGSFGIAFNTSAHKKNRNCHQAILAKSFTMNLASQQVQESQEVLEKDGHFSIGMRPMSYQKFDFVKGKKRMSLTVHNPPDYDTRSYALQKLSFKAGNFQLDEKAVEAWAMQGTGPETKGLLKGYILIPIEFVQPLQEEK